MNINWYPGHMAKAKQMIHENLKLVDMVIEIVDARAPKSSTNPDFQKLYSNKIRVVILNKNDYADQEKTVLWLNHFAKQKANAFSINALDNKEIRYIKSKLFEIVKQKRDEIKKRKGINKTIRAMVLGIPNVGKSTFINSIAGKAKTKTGDKPGVTKAKQWVKIAPYFELLDTPGMLWPKFEDKTIGLHLIYIGSIKEEIIDPVEVAINLLAEMTKLYPNALMNRYKLDKICHTSYELLETIAINRGMLKLGSIPDTDRCAITILNEYQAGLLGGITLEVPK